MSQVVAPGQHAVPFFGNCVFLKITKLKLHITVQGNRYFLE
jgi:hypothetical protein